MPLTRFNRSGLACLLTLAVAGCGTGGGGPDPVQTIPPPPPPPAPPPPPPPPPPPSAAQPIEIFDNPATQEFTTLTPGSSQDGIKIRYDATTKAYEVLPGETTVWQGLRPHHSYASTPNQYFAFGPTALDDMSFFFTYAQPNGGYRYSNIAIWGKGVGAYWDDATFTAFGMATPAGSVPVIGSATYAGDIVGTSSYRLEDNLVGGTVQTWITGSINLAFNFQSGTLSGSIQPFLTEWDAPISLGTFTFKDTVYSSGATGFSGTFDTAAVGTNGFNGVFAGPAAQEAMGRWNLPFVRPADGKTYDAWGAFIAKR